MTELPALQEPELPELETVALAAAVADAALIASGVRIDGDRRSPVTVRRVRLSESELHGVSLSGGGAPGLALRDVILDGCALSNLDGREGTLRRVAIARSQLVGLGLRDGDLRDVRITDSSLELASLAGARLRDVVFERVNLADASFMHARLEAVTFIGCRLGGSDFRGARVTACAIRESSLDGMLGRESLRGVRMPWPDVVDSAGALAAALGIAIEE